MARLPNKKRTEPPTFVVGKYSLRPYDDDESAPHKIVKRARKLIAAKRELRRLKDL